MEVNKSISKKGLTSPPRSLDNLDKPAHMYYFTPQVTKKKPESLANLDQSNDSGQYKIFQSIQHLPYINTKKKPKSKNKEKVGLIFFRLENNNKSK